MGHYIFSKSDVPGDVRSMDDPYFASKVKLENSSGFMTRLKELHIKGVNASSVHSMKEFISRCTNLEELVLLTKPRLLGNHRLKFSAHEEYEFCNIINENILKEILRRNPLPFLKMFIASTVEPCPSGCTLRLTEER